MKLLYDQPLYMPEGSVRSLLALGVLGGYFAGLVSDDVLLLVLGVYFGGRLGSEQRDR